MGANRQATLFELQHREILRGIARTVALKRGMTSFEEHILYDDILTEFNAKKLWIVPANVEDAQAARS